MAGHDVGPDAANLLLGDRDREGRHLVGVQPGVARIRLGIGSIQLGPARVQRDLQACIEPMYTFSSVLYAFSSARYAFSSALYTARVISSLFQAAMNCLFAGRSAAAE